MSQYGQKLNPIRRLRTQLGIKCERQSMVVTCNPSTIAKDQIFTIKFPSLGQDDLIVPGTVRLGFNIEIESDNPECYFVNNLGRMIIKKIVN